MVYSVDDNEPFYDADDDIEDVDHLRYFSISERHSASPRDLSSGLISVLPGQHYSMHEKTLHLSFIRENGLIDSGNAQKPIVVDLKLDASPGCGGIVWPAGQILASYLIKQGPEYTKGRNVVELGSGTGLVGLVAAMLGGNVWITDQLPLLDIMQENVSLNDLSSNCTVAELDWGSPLPIDIPRPDLILAADCVYFEPAFPLLVKTLCDLVDAKTEVLFCYKKRRKADKRFFAMLKKKFAWAQVMDDPDSAIYSRESITLVRLTRLAVSVL